MSNRKSYKIKNLTHSFLVRKAMLSESENIALRFFISFYS